MGMKERSELCESPEEELWNTLTHGFGALLSLGALAWMTLKAIPLGAMAVTGVVVFGVSLVLLYTASTWYHFVRADPWKRALQLVDHTLIYVLIAGSYTPWLLMNLRGVLGWTLLVLIWALAVVGVILKLVYFPRFQRFGLFLYIAMGWFVVVAIKPMFESVSGSGMTWLFVGGVCYTVGVIFFAAEKLKFGHFVWHLFVLAGSVSHIVAVFVGVLVSP